jgi:hypothetical protein
MTDLVAICARFEKIQAEKNALQEALACVLALISREGGFRHAEDQALLRGARALLAEMGVATRTV